MVRLVFRPYTQVRRTICTSVSLQASTRVSPGFAIPKHSSPSFGSQHACWARSTRPCLTGSLSLRSGVCTLLLARMLDSLVRVSRRVSAHSGRVAGAPSAGERRLLDTQPRASRRTHCTLQRDSFQGLVSPLALAPALYALLPPQRFQVF